MRTGAACSPPPAPRLTTEDSPRSTGVRLAALQRDSGVHLGLADRPRAAARGRRVQDRARPRPRQRLRRLSRVRPVLRLRPHQRGLPGHEPRRREGGRRGLLRGRDLGELARGSEPQGRRRPRRRPADLRRARAPRAPREFVDGRRVTSAAALRSSASRSPRHAGSAPPSGPMRCHCRTACSRRSRSPSSATSGGPSRRRPGRSFFDALTGRRDPSSPRSRTGR